MVRVADTNGPLGEGGGGGGSSGLENDGRLVDEGLFCVKMSWAQMCISCSLAARFLRETHDRKRSTAFAQGCCAQSGCSVAILYYCSPTVFIVRLRQVKVLSDLEPTCLPFFVLFDGDGDILCTGQEFDGSDSGARPDEAVSWGKIKLDAKPVKVCRLHAFANCHRTVAAE